LEEKAVSDFLTISIYKWFFRLLEQYLETNPIAKSVVLEMGFTSLLRLDCREKTMFDALT